MIDGCGRNINYLRLSVTDRCDLRCRYCMPQEGVCQKSREDRMTEEEMLQAVTVAASLGITKVRITGGEPLGKKNILSICRGISGIPGIEEVCLTTNGTRLSKMARPLCQAGVKKLNISLDTLVADKYQYITRGGSFAQVWNGFLAALDAGFEKIKINTVLLGGFNEEEIVPLGNLTRQYPVDVRFIEWMPMDDGGEFQAEAQIPCTRVLSCFQEAVPVPPDGGVARLYQLPGALGRIGLITPVSNHFCGECRRIRLSSDGKLKPCLHSSRELSVKGMDVPGMRAQFQKAIEEKPLCHGPLSPQNRSKAGRRMNEIGG